MHPRFKRLAVINKQIFSLVVLSLFSFIVNQKFFTKNHEKASFLTIDYTTSKKIW